MRCSWLQWGSGVCSSALNTTLPHHNSHHITLRSFSLVLITDPIALRNQVRLSPFHWNLLTKSSVSLTTLCTISSTSSFLIPFPFPFPPNRSFAALPSNGRPPPPPPLPNLISSSARPSRSHPNPVVSKYSKKVQPEISRGCARHHFCTCTILLAAIWLILAASIWWWSFPIFCWRAGRGEEEGSISSVESAIRSWRA